MKRWFVAVVWMLVLALPLQGLAAAARLTCHHAQPAQTASAAQASPCHGAEAVADPVLAPAGCIACAACHGIAALPTPLPLVLPAPPSQAPAAVIAVTVPPFITAGPERPPRSALA